MSLVFQNDLFEITREGIRHFRLWPREAFYDQVDSKTLPVRAIELSIRKWETLRDQTIAFQEYITDGGTLTCALCGTFMTDEAEEEDEACNNCPIHHATGQAFCRGTPYYAYVDVNEGDLSEVTSAAQAEINFLNSVLQGLAHG